MPLIKLQNDFPKLSEGAFVAETASVIGKVQLDAGSAVLYNATARGDGLGIIIGENTTIGEHCCMHTSNVNYCRVGNFCVVEAGAVLHGCTVEDYCHICESAAVMDGAVIGRGSVVEAGALVTKGTVVPPFSVVSGLPAKVTGTLDETAIEKHRAMAQGCAQRWRRLAK